MTLFDIFYQHTEWWCNPDLGHDTQGKYGDVLKEMEDCALEYARSIKDTGDRWKRVIENETRELCRANHYSWNLRGDKKEWHDTVVRDFLIRIRKAIEHCYGYNFTELPKSILPSYGIYCDEWPTNRKPQQKDIEAPQQPIVGNSGELAGNGNENVTEALQQPIRIITINNTDLEISVFGKAITKVYITLKPDGTYEWNKTNRLLAYMCGRLYCGDRIREDKSDYTTGYKKGRGKLPAKELKNLFGVDVGKTRDNIDVPEHYDIIDELFK